MATVDKALADEIIAKKGRYANDPPVHQVIEYKNRWGETSYAILYKEDVDCDRYHESDYVQEPKILWQLKP